MDVQITIHALTHRDGEKDTIDLTVDGQLTPFEGGYQLVYAEGLMTDEENVETIMRIQSSKISILRQGVVHSLLLLERSKRHFNSYDTGYGQLMMGIYTRELQVDMTETGGSLSFVYTMDINSGMKSEHEVKMIIKEMSKNVQNSKTSA